jgi:hypothetical protein
MHWAEAEGLLRLNNGNQESFGSSYNFTTRLPAEGYDGEHARLRDMWGNANSQETVGISPRMFHGNARRAVEVARQEIDRF